MKNKPLILLTGGHITLERDILAYRLNCNYAELVKRAGGIPILAIDDGGTLAKDYAALADGLLLSGGDDVSPELYNTEKSGECKAPDPLRDALEMALIAAFVELKKPIFGVCRGSQILNVFFGGTLWQDIPTELESEHESGICHDVTLEKGSVLHGLYGEKLSVNSSHHQCVRELAEPLQATAYAEIGKTSIVEAFEHKTLPILAVQWHPERMTGAGTVPEQAVDSLPFFKAFLQR